MHRTLSWKILPAKDQRKLAVFLVIITAFIVIVFISMGIYWAIFSLLILLGSLFQFYTVTEYILDDDGVTVKRPFYTLKRSWKEFRRVEETKSGVFLSPFSHPSRLDNFRGIHLIVDRDKKTEVMEFIKEKLER